MFIEKNRFVFYCKKKVAGGYGAGATPERLNNPFGIDVDNAGTIYIADYNNHRIQMWYPGAAVGITIAGQTGVAGSWSYLLNNPAWVVYDQQYNYLYIMDSANDRIQRWVPGAQFGTTMVSSSTMVNPFGLTITSTGDFLVADFNQYRVLQFSMSCRMYIIQFENIFFCFFFKLKLQAHQQQHYQHVSFIDK